jgi:outer membrane protein TolC
MRARIWAPFALLLAVLLVPAALTVAQERPTLQLSLDEAVKRALENNVDIAVDRYNPDLSAQSVRSAEGYYDPFLFSTLTHSSADTKGTTAISGGTVVNSKSRCRSRLERVSR